MLDQILEIAQCAEQAMEKNQGLSLAFLYILEFTLVLYFVFHERVVVVR